MLKELFYHCLILIDRSGKLADYVKNYAYDHHLPKEYRGRWKSDWTYKNYPHPGNLMILIGNQAMSVCIAKAACSNIKAIAIYDKTGVWHDETPDIMHKLSEENGLLASIGKLRGHYPEGVLRFAVYNDPYKRLISIFQDKVKGPNTLLYYDRLGTKFDKSFAYFMTVVRHELEKSDPLQMDDHIRRQTDYYTEDDVDYIVPIQYLDDFLREHNLPLPPRHVNVSKKPKDYSEFEPFREEIQRLYARDYELLKSKKLYRR